MNNAQKRAFEKVGLNQFDKKDRSRPLASIVSLRSRLLREAVKVRPAISTDLERDLLPMYREIRLFCFEADRRRSKLFTKPIFNYLDLPREYQKKREWWTSTCRPQWTLLERAWMKRSKRKPFLFDFPEYFATKGRDGISVNTPLDTPHHDDPKIANFITAMMDWSCSHHLDVTWAREHAFETLDIWAIDNEIRAAGVWQDLPNHLLTGEVTIHPFGMTVPELRLNVDIGEMFGKALSFYPGGIGKRKDMEAALDDLLYHAVDTLKSDFATFLDSREKEAKRKGFVEAESEPNDQHFKWLVQVQFLDRSTKELGTEHHKIKKSNVVDESKIVRAPILELAKLIGLPLRTGRHKTPSRPR